MFDLGWSELMLIGIVALIVIGPKELPTVLRTVGRTLTRVRRMASDFQGQFQDALRDADVAEMRDEISKVADVAKKAMPDKAKELFDPLRSVRDEIRASVTGATAALALPETPAAAKEPAGVAEVAQYDPLQSVRDEIRASVAKALPAAAVTPPALPEAEQDVHDLLPPVPPSPLERTELPPPLPSETDVARTGETEPDTLAQPVNGAAPSNTAS